MEIEEGNKLIAEFLGYKKQFIDCEWYEYPRVFPFCKPYKSESKIKRMLPNSMLYHYSWDWQVPAWGKAALAVKSYLPIWIKSKGLNEVDSREIIGWYLKIVEKYESAVFLNKPEDGHSQIVELINWHNQNCL